LVKDLSEIPKDDYTNLQILEKKNIISERVREAISEATGLRNRIIHEYNGLDHRVAYTSIFNLLNGIESFTREVSKWLSKI
jgi:uncharacterized protein YutE (UPF0331/DUF86 family)